jgi:flagellar biogenesis protein FliO
VPSTSHLVALVHRAPVEKGRAARVVAGHTAAHASTGAQSVSASSLLVQMTIGLVVIIVLIKLASKFVQGRQGRSLGRGPRPQGVAVIGRQSLGKGVQVAMVAAGTQTFLLGVTQRQVTLLGQLDSDEAEPVDNHDEAAGLTLLGGTRPALTAGGYVPAWKSAVEQMRVRTTRRA